MKNKIINLAIEQLGNDYETYCKDMGYNYRIEWCACFISWLAKKLKITDILMSDLFSRVGYFGRAYPNIKELLQPISRLRTLSSG